MNKSAFYDFEFGILEIEYTDAAVVSLKRVEQVGAHSERSARSDEAFDQIAEYLQGKRQVFDFPVELHGTEFQKKVWNALCRIPYGETRTYRQIAEEIDSPKACRAVGMANNKNPMMLVVPCHRVIGADGSLVGYAGGLDMKRALLERERVTAATGEAHPSDR